MIENNRALSATTVFLGRAIMAPRLLRRIRVAAALQACIDDRRLARADAPRIASTAAVDNFVGNRGRSTAMA
jgi:serine/threonine protein kinase HipA of HipAB toxin-antitoxin module